MAQRWVLRLAVAGAVLAAAAGTVPATAIAGTVEAGPATGLNAVQHIVVIYEENHSFDNLFGSWPGVNGLSSADAAHTVQVGVNGRPLACLPQNDANLSTPPLAAKCTDSSTTPSTTSAFVNAPFTIDDYVAATDVTCPNGVIKNSPGAEAGGCTKDMLHAFYNEQYQIDGGKLDRFVVGSDAIGLTMGHYDTAKLPLYKYLTGAGAPKYVVADNFFQGAFGGSFLNHQWLVAAQTPVFAGADNSGGAGDLHSVLGADGSGYNLPLHPAVGVQERALSVGKNPDGTCKQAVTTVCGDYAVNTVQPPYQPTGGGTTLPPLTSSNIGDELSAANVDWAWYSGGWSNADGDVNAPGWTNGAGPTCSDPAVHSGATYPHCADKLFQYHHQPFNYFANYAPGTAARAAHLKDEAEFLSAVSAGTLKAVSFIKPVGEENEHPGYSSTPLSQSHLVDTIRAIESGPQASSTMIIVTYDEFGGQWDHVSPPTGAGVSDQWGPGNRIPGLVISPLLPVGGVDHTQYDTTSILATIEARYGLAHLSSRDAAVNTFAGDLTPVPAGASQYMPLTPTRIFDSRPDSYVGYSGAKPAANADIRVPVTGSGGVPVGATAVVLNVTATEAASPGFVQAFPTGSGTAGSSSTLNVERVGQTIANSAIVPIGSDGSITVHTQPSAHLIVDVAGYYVPAIGAVGPGRLNPLAPTRIFDTRSGSAVNFSGAKPGAASTTRVAVTGKGGVPTTGVEAAVLNLTATDASGAGFVQIAPAGQLSPGASSNLNLERIGETIANQVVVPVGAGGSVDIYSQSGTNLVVDVAGYITDSTATRATAGLFVPVAPGRLLDTRAGSAVGYSGATPAAGASITVPVAARFGLPSTGVAAIAANVTITEAAGPGFVQTAPAGSLHPGDSSSVNADTTGQTIANAAIIPVSATGFDIYTQTGGQLLTDVSGWYSS
ncbi:MAG: acid phosphatase [Ilumatobacteraceae bacterium]|nr:acid phosphatase [Ilumatobacteraceae bacterium]MCU1388110.1 acid phosphatase [Ilumatobacteraceae bacterium]